MTWKRMKGMVKAVNKCPRCDGLYPDEDYCFDEDLCLTCLFPEAGDKLPAELDETGRNFTKEREMLDNLDYLPEKQSESAQKAFSEFKNRKLYK